MRAIGVLLGLTLLEGMFVSLDLKCKNQLHYPAVCGIQPAHSRAQFSR